MSSCQPANERSPTHSSAASIIQIIDALESQRLATNEVEQLLCQFVRRASECQMRRMPELVIANIRRPDEIPGQIERQRRPDEADTAVLRLSRVIHPVVDRVHQHHRRLEVHQQCIAGMAVAQIRPVRLLHHRREDDRPICASYVILVSAVMGREGIQHFAGFVLIYLHSVEEVFEKFRI